MRTVDINCDMGESTHLWDYHINHDLAILPYISSLNVACGFHAGDPTTMHHLIEAALEKGVAVGAHPGYMDREHFGRKEHHLPARELYDLLCYQMGATATFLNLHKSTLHHVKPHGALYNQASSDIGIANVIIKAVQDFDKELLLYVLSGSLMENLAKAHGVKTCSEVFADRTYTSGAKLTARSEPDALIDDVTIAIRQVTRMVQEGKVLGIDGNDHAILAETICVHSDGAHALELVKSLHDGLLKNKINIQAI